MNWIIEEYEPTELQGYKKEDLMDIISPSTRTKEH